MRFIGSNNERVVKDVLLTSLPRIYENSRVVNEIVRVDAEELENLYSNMNDVFNQFFVDTATWGLTTWEEIYNIPTDSSKSDSDRRSVIKSKMRGQGVTTTALIKNIAESWYNGTVQVTEDNANYQVKISFASSYGAPSNINDIQAAIAEVVPAHLGIMFEYLYYFIKDIHGKMTLQQMQTITLDKFAGE